MAYITEIEWLRARWMVLHNFARIAEEHLTGGGQ